jgi:predicted TIM-barrel fold metal-dependent hydrolase
MRIVGAVLVAAPPRVRNIGLQIAAHSTKADAFSMRIIDAHVHLYPPEVGNDPAAWAAAHDETHWAILCTRRRRSGRPVQTFPSVDQLLHDMDVAGVEKAVLLGWYWERPATCTWQNRFYAECTRAHPDRLAAFATIHPSAGVSAVQAEIRHAHEDGLCGLGELSPHSQRYAMDDPVLEVALALAAELCMPVNLHVTDPKTGQYPGRVETPLEDFVRLSTAHPRVKFILAHWGGGMALRVVDPDQQRILANIFYDTAASPLTHNTQIWRTVLDVVPPEKVIFGTDYPLDLYPKSDDGPGWRRILSEVGGSGLTANEQRLLLGENAGRLLGL